MMHMGKRNTWDVALSFFRFESSFEESGLREAFEEWDPHFGPFFPPHEPLTLSELALGFDKVLSGEISFPKFKMWSRLACLSFSEYPTDRQNRFFIFYAWEELNNALYPQNVSRVKMTELIREFKTNLLSQRYAFMPEEAFGILDRVEELWKIEAKDDGQKKELLELLAKLGELGDFEAYTEIGSHYYSGRLGIQDYAKASEYYQKAAAMGSVQGLINYGYINYYARCGGDPDYQTAFDCFLKASKIGDEEERIEALYKLSDMYDRGYATRRSPRKAYSIVKSLYHRLVSDSFLPGQEYLGDLAIRMAKFHSKDGLHPDPRAALRYYLLARHLIQERWDGQWFGDKKLLETCEREIPPLVESVFGGEYPRDHMDLGASGCALMLIEGGGYALSNILYDQERKELYLYLHSPTVKAIETIPYVGSSFTLCLVFKAKKVRLTDYDFLLGAFLNNARMMPSEGYEESLIRHWSLFAHDEDNEVEVAEFVADFKAHGYIGYIRDSSSQIVYQNPTFSQPKGYESRCVFRFFFEFGGEFLWPLNEEAYANYDYPCDIGDFGFSEGLKRDLAEALEVYERHGSADDETDEEYWDHAHWAEFYRTVERPLYERVKAELGDDFVVIYDGGDKDPAQ